MLKSSRSDSKLTQEPQIINKFGPDPKLVNCQDCKKEADVNSGLVKIINTLRNVNYIRNINLFSSLIFC